MASGWKLFFMEPTLKGLNLHSRLAVLKSPPNFGGLSFIFKLTIPQNP